MPDLEAVRSGVGALWWVLRWKTTSLVLQSCMMKIKFQLPASPHAPRRWIQSPASWFRNQSTCELRPAGKWVWFSFLASAQGWFGNPRITSLSKVPYIFHGIVPINFVGTSLATCFKNWSNLTCFNQGFISQSSPDCRCSEKGLGYYGGHMNNFKIYVILFLCLARSLSSKGMKWEGLLQSYSWLELKENIRITFGVTGSEEWQTWSSTTVCPSLRYHFILNQVLTSVWREWGHIILPTCVS
jgi:hypothetical protein